MARRLNVGLVGIGRWGRNILRVLSKLRNFIDNIVICDINPVNLEYASRSSRVKSKYTSIDEMLSKEDLDAVFVAVTPQHLASVSLKVLMSNINVFIEKPVACNYRDAEKLYMEAKKRSLIAVPGFIMRFSPTVNLIKELIGKLGRPYTIDFMRLSRRPPTLRKTNVLLDLGIHDIDLMFYLLNCSSVKVSCVHRFVCKDGESYNISLLCDDSSIFIRVDELSPMKIREVCVIGDKYCIRGNFVNENLTYVIDGERFEKNVVGGEPLKLEVIEFLKAIIGEESSSPTLDDALKALKVIDEIFSKSLTLHRE